MHPCMPRPSVAHVRCISGLNIHGKIVGASALVSAPAHPQQSRITASSIRVQTEHEKGVPFVWNKHRGWCGDNLLDTEKKESIKTCLARRSSYSLEKKKKSGRREKGKEEGLAGRRQMEQNADVTCPYLAWRQYMLAQRRH